MKTEYEPDTQYTAAETSLSDPSPNEVFPKTNGLSLSPVDIDQASINNPFLKIKEAQDEFIYECLYDGSYIRNPDAMDEENNRRFPFLSYLSSRNLFPAVFHHMSNMLKNIDGPDQAIFGEDGFVQGYCFPCAEEPIVGTRLSRVFGSRCFSTLPDAWKADSYLAEVGLHLERYYRVLAHPRVGFIAPDGEGAGWLPGSVNRRKDENGGVHGSVDYVIRDPGTGTLLLTPHGLVVLEDRLLDWTRRIF